MSARYAAFARRDTRPELAVRRELHRRGMRYRVEYRVPGLPRRRVDVAFTKVRLAVMVDGCFWHHCPQHGVVPERNADWWRWKFSVNEARDRDTDERLRELGWTVARFWEHESPELVANRVQDLWETLRAAR
ncbi:MAG: very short patch repair endonuclease [Actinobacteria bacterium]|nr:very short patch repair endonuclease [Actinomycetota bacterium]